MSILGPIKKSKPYSISGNSVSFSNANNKFIGMSIKNSNGLFQPEDNKSSNFNVFKASEESLDALENQFMGLIKMHIHHRLFLQVMKRCHNFLQVRRKNSTTHNP